jgi:enoyl-CoA hydratase/carnithine racemase
MQLWSDDVQHDVIGQIGCITLQRPKALNALSLPMVRELTAVLQRWANDDAVLAVAIRGSDKHGPFGAFCAGGDIRFFHAAAHAGDARLEDFFTEEYSLNHLIHRYPKPYIAFMDGIVMGGGMGLSQGARWRIVTERTQMAMPETLIGLFPDVGGGYFLSRCPGHAGEYLALTGQSLHGAEALHFGLADALSPSADVGALWQGLTEKSWARGDDVVNWVRQQTAPTTPKAHQAQPAWWHADLDAVFGLPTVSAIVTALKAHDPHRTVLQALLQRSPLMLHVALAQIRRARSLSLADDLRMERDMVRHCFHADHLQRRGPQTDTVEGIRALAVDKDRQPHWQPARVDDVTPEMVDGFFVSPWPATAHPLRHLRD